MGAYDDCKTEAEIQKRYEQRSGGIKAAWAVRECWHDEQIAKAHAEAELAHKQFVTVCIIGAIAFVGIAAII